MGEDKMRKFSIYLLFFILAVTACAESVPTQTDGVLRITSDSASVEYSRSELEALPTAEATFLEIDYLGVRLIDLLTDAGYDLSEVAAVKAIAVDGFSANYGPDLISRSDTLVSYSRVGEALASDESPFRMVLPGQEGKLNVRQLAEIQVIH
jgi:hypothetical protein